MGKKNAAALKKLKEAKEKKEAADKAAKEAQEHEAKCAAEAEGEGDPEDKGDENSGAGDAEKDKELIKKMLDEYVGKTDEMDQEAREAMEGLAMEAYQGHKEMGANEAEAYERAGHSLKLAKHMASKQVESDKVAKEAAAKEAKESAEKAAKEAAAKEAGDGDDKEKESKQKESARVKALEAELLETKGRLAKVEAVAKKGEVSQYVDKKLAESKQPNSVTKAFREAAGEIKSTADFDSKWKLFSEGAKRNDGDTVLDWTPFQEKASTADDPGGSEGGKNLNFSDCAE